MKRIHLNKIKSYESPPKKVNIFSEKEIKMIKEHYDNLPETTFNKKQNVRKKAWIQNHNKELDKMYYNKLKEFFNKNDILYFMSYRLIGGGGPPYSLQNILPVLFNMPVKNYVIATFVGSMPSMFVTVSLGSGIESIIEKNEELSILRVIISPEIYLPIAGFFILLIIAFFIKKIYFKSP